MEDKERYLPGLKGFRYHYFTTCRKDWCDSLKHSSALTVLLMVPYMLSSKSGFELILIAVDVVLRICVPLLAFMLAGYSLIMGKEIEGLTSSTTKSGLSMYQKLNTVFVAMLVATLTCVMITVSVAIVAKCEIVLPCMNSFQTILTLINAFVYLAIVFFLSYMLFCVKDLLSNLFSLGQYIQKSQDEKRNAKHSDYPE